MTDLWTDRLSEYLDDELAPAERTALERHLEACADCSATLAELRAVVARAANLPTRPPATDLWSGIEPRLDPVKRLAAAFEPRVRRRVSFTLPQLVAAGLALMVMSGGAVWILRNGGPATDFPPLAATSDAGSLLLPVATADPRYDEAIADLEQALAAGRSQLDPGTIRILKSNLQAIDQAIEQSRRALAADPANVYLHSHIADARQRKLALLRRGVGLIDGKS
jgi:tetratricopeptide (TPR) repeat protein